MKQDAVINKISDYTWTICEDWASRALLTEFDIFAEEPDQYVDKECSVFAALNEKICSDMAIHLGLPFAPVLYAGAKKDKESGFYSIGICSRKCSGDAEDLFSFGYKNPMSYRRAENFLAQFRSSFGASVAHQIWFSDHSDTCSQNIIYMKQRNGIYFIDFEYCSPIAQIPPYKKDSEYDPDWMRKSMRGEIMHEWRCAVSRFTTEKIRGYKIFDRCSFDNTIDAINHVPEAVMNTTVELAKMGIEDIINRDGVMTGNLRTDIDAYCASFMEVLCERRKTIPALAHVLLGPQNYPLRSVRAEKILAARL